MYYYQIITKLNATIKAFGHIALINQYKNAFEISELITLTPDGQINHLLAITVSLLNHVPESPYLEELFSNYLKDYLHLVNPELPVHAEDLYLSLDFVPQPSQTVLIPQYAFSIA